MASIATTVPASGCPAGWTTLATTGQRLAGWNCRRRARNAGTGEGNILGRLDMAVSRQQP